MRALFLYPSYTPACARAYAHQRFYPPLPALPAHAAERNRLLQFECVRPGFARSVSPFRLEQPVSNRLVCQITPN
jgi:hypothetical protein